MMNFKGMNPQLVVDALAIRGIAASIEPSVVQDSPYAYVYIYLSDKEHEGPHIIISDAAEYEDSSAVLVGTHADWETSSEDLTYEPTVQAAVERAVKLCQTEH